MTGWVVAVFLFIALAGIGIGGLVGHRLTYVRMRERAAHAHGFAATQIAAWRQNETFAGAFNLSGSADRPVVAIEGAADCYYSPPDFERVGWCGKDMPTPFVGCAPTPGPIAGGFINSMQFRYHREIEPAKPKNTVRIFVTGGSTAFGCGASSNDTTIGGYLETQLNEALLDRGIHCEVITAACGAWCSTQERILIENRLIELEADIVISVGGQNDVFWATSGRNILWFRVFQDDYFLTLANATLASNFAEEFPSGDPGAGPPVGCAQAARRLAWNASFSHQALATVGADYVYALQPVLAVSRKIRTPREQSIAASVEATGWFMQMEEFYRHFRAALRAIQRPGFHFVDTSSVFDDSDGETGCFLDTCHFGDRGNDMIARCLRGHVLPIIEDRLARPTEG